MYLLWETYFGCIAQRGVNHDSRQQSRRGDKSSKNPKGNRVPKCQENGNGPPPQRESRYHTEYVTQGQQLG